MVAEPHGPNWILGPTVPWRGVQTLKADWNSVELGSSPLMLAGENIPCPLGSGKLGTPCLRMHAAKLAIACACSAR
jgi:hypothetical protein